MSTGAVVVLVILLVLVAAAAAWFVVRQSRRQRLRRRFGPEYDRQVEATGDRRGVERELSEREKRHARYRLRPLADDERIRYGADWTAVQEQFVDRPAQAVVAAEQLVQKVMRARGYPTDDFETQASDLSVEHANAVVPYRDGHDIRLRHERAGVSTEELRQALTRYRAVFVSVAGIHEPASDDHAAATHGRADGVHRTEAPRDHVGQPRRTT